MENTNTKTKTQELPVLMYISCNALWLMSTVHLKTKTQVLRFDYCEIEIKMSHFWEAKEKYNVKSESKCVMRFVYVWKHRFSLFFTVSRLLLSSCPENTGHPTSNAILSGNKKAWLLSPIITTFFMAGFWPLPLQLNARTQLLELCWIPITSHTTNANKCALLHGMQYCAN